MATNQNFIAITIKAFLPTGKTLDEQFAALSIVKAAHESGDYAALLKAAQDVEVKTEAKKEAAPATTREGANIHGIGPDEGTGPNPDFDPDFSDLPDTIPTMDDADDFALAAEAEEEPARANRKK